MLNSSGIGYRLCEVLLTCNAKVIAVSRTEANLNALKEKHPEIETIVLDLSDWDATKSKLKDVGNRVDHLVNNAAQAQDFSLGEITEEAIDKQFNTNYKAVINLIQLVSSGMKERRLGSIVNVSSVAGIAALEKHTVYGSTKAAMDMVTKIAAKELGPFNVRVNSVNPTVVWTEMGRQGWSDPERQLAMTSKIPMNRFVEVDEVVHPIIFLLSEYSSMINGVMLPIDGGFVAC